MSDVKAKINKLLAMAADARGNEHENEVAMRMAERLMRQHNIDIADLQTATGKPATFVWSKIKIAVGPKAAPSKWRPIWCGVMALGVGRFTDCKVTWASDDFYGNVIEFSGDAVDLEYASWLFKRLRDVGYAESMQVEGRYRGNFCKAYGSRLQHRLQELRRERDQAMKATGTGTALVVVQNKIALRDREFGRQKTSSSRSSGANSARRGYSEGHATADRANFAKPIGSGDSNPRLS